MKTLRIAIATEGSHQYTVENFNMANNFSIYEYKSDRTDLKLMNEIANPVLLMDDEELRIPYLIEFLKKNEIDLLVARNFSIKLKMQCKYFVPVIIDKQITIEQICMLIQKNIRWLIDELALNKKENMVFNITKGIYKYKIENEK